MYVRGGANVVLKKYVLGERSLSQAARFEPQQRELCSNTMFRSAAAGWVALQVDHACVRRGAERHGGAGLGAEFLHDRRYRAADPCVDDIRAGADYELPIEHGCGRDKNPTFVQPQAMIADLEGGADALLFAFGMAA